MRGPRPRPRSNPGQLGPCSQRTSHLAAAAPHVWTLDLAPPSPSATCTSLRYLGPLGACAIPPLGPYRPRPRTTPIAAPSHPSTKTWPPKPGCSPCGPSPYGGGSQGAHDTMLIDAQGVPHTVSRQELEQAGQAQLESEQQASSHLSPPPRRLYFCPICLRTFLYQSDLERHSITHSESKPHVCRACGKAFKRASHLQRHRHIHTGQRPFSCHVCHKGFRESGELLRHQRVHTGEKPYQCQLCRLRFTERNTLRRHAKRKHARETFYQRSAAEGGAGGWDDGNWAANNTGLGSWGAWGGGEGSDWGEVPEKMADGDGGETPVTAPESEGTRSEERAGTQLP
uniref:C2H2-type domain-containing protein n=1 Tax=Sphenodon punctatus TaxID=8508 RepID=A0A8D0GY96_SPHPU